MKQDVPSTLYSWMKMLCVAVCSNNEKHVVGIAHLLSLWSWLPTTLELMLALEGPATGWPGLPSLSTTCDIHPRLLPDKMLLIPGCVQHLTSFMPPDKNYILVS